MRLDTVLCREPADRLRAELTETKIVQGRSRAVSVAPQLDDESRILLQPPNDVTQCRARLIVGKPFVDAELEHGLLDDGQCSPRPPEPSQPLGSSFRSGPSLLARYHRLIGARPCSGVALDGVGGPARGHVRHAEGLNRRPGGFLAGASYLRKLGRELPHLGLVLPEVAAELVDGRPDGGLAPCYLHADELTRGTSGQREREGRSQHQSAPSHSALLRP